MPTYQACIINLKLMLQSLKNENDDGDLKETKSSICESKKLILHWYTSRFIFSLCGLGYSYNFFLNSFKAITWLLESKGWLTFSTKIYPTTLTSKIMMLGGPSRLDWVILLGCTLSIMLFVEGLELLTYFLMLDFWLLHPCLHYFFSKLSFHSDSLSLGL